MSGAESVISSLEWNTESRTMTRDKSFWSAFAALQLAMFVTT